MRANSLALRLFLSATVWTVLILLVTGFALSGLYRSSTERGFDRRLGVYLKTLIADLAAPDIPIEKTGQMLGEPLFELPLTTLFQVRFGLAPLSRISRGLAAIRSGKAEKLEGRFPVEIEPLARETNALLDSNREIVERARTHVGNLAHALKIPLSVMMNEAAARGEDPLA